MIAKHLRQVGEDKPRTVLEFGLARLEQVTAVDLQVDLIAVVFELDAVGEIGAVDHALHLGHDHRLDILDRRIGGIHAEQILDRLDRLRIATLARGEVDHADLVTVAVDHLDRFDSCL